MYFSFSWNIELVYSYSYIVQKCIDGIWFALCNTENDCCCAKRKFGVFTPLNYNVINRNSLMVKKEMKQEEVDDSRS